MFDLFTSGHSFRNHLCVPSIELPPYGKALHSLSVTKQNRLFCGQKDFNQTSKKWIFEEWLPQKEKIYLITASIATVEPKVSAPSENGHRSFTLLFESNSESQELPSSEDDSHDMDEKERLRRTRISKANKGNVPWNKGRRHSPETLQRIRERTKMAMQDPKVKMKLMNLGHAQSEETRIKIGAGVREGCRRRQEMLMVQESCLFSWQNIIAKAARIGYGSEDKMQWDSYKILDEQLKKEWLESIEKRKTMPRPKGSNRAPKSAEQRRKISEAISAKWADPEYRRRVFSALSKYHGVPIGIEGKRRRRRPLGEASSVKRDRVPRKPVKPKDTDCEAKSIEKGTTRRRRNAAPSYKDPMASSKLEMIRKIRAERVAMENKKKEAIKKAKLLIAEAEKAAKALEVAALKSPLAQASLIEARKLIAEASRSIECIECGQRQSHDSMEEDSFSSDVQSNNNFQPINESDNCEKDLDGRIENSFHLSSSDQRKYEDFDDDRFMLPSFEPNDAREDPGANVLRAGQPKINGFIKYINPLPEREVTSKSEEGETNVCTPKTKKWVRGKLVEVDD